MLRRDFLMSSIAGAAGFFPGLALMHRSPERSDDRDALLPRRPFRDDVFLSILGCGGIVVMGGTTDDAKKRVADAIRAGVNYFDVAPSYGDGEAEEKLGPALQPYRRDVFLACKTMQRESAGAQEELERSLGRLRTDHLDLYQFHAVTTQDDVEKIFAPRGAIECFTRARKEGMTRYIGFSAHSEEAALAMMDRFPFDSILFPVNLVCMAQSNFGPRVIARAKEKGVARLALKALAHTPWPSGAGKTHAKCWYKPITDPGLAREALRFTLSEDVTAAIPPGDEGLFSMALTLAREFAPLSQGERTALLKQASAWKPLFPL